MSVCESLSLVWWLFPRAVVTNRMAGDCWPPKLLVQPWPPAMVSRSGTSPCHAFHAPASHVWLAMFHPWTKWLAFDRRWITVSRTLKYVGGCQRMFCNQIKAWYQCPKLQNCVPECLECSMSGKCIWRSCKEKNWNHFKYLSVAFYFSLARRVEITRMYHNLIPCNNPIITSSHPLRIFSPYYLF